MKEASPNGDFLEFAAALLERDLPLAAEILARLEVNYGWISLVAQLDTIKAALQADDDAGAARLFREAKQEEDQAWEAGKTGEVWPGTKS